jgi:hypothetical protein
MSPLNGNGFERPRDMELVRLKREIRQLKEGVKLRAKVIERGAVGATANIIKVEGADAEIVEYNFTSSGEKGITHHLGRVPTGVEVINFKRAGNFTTNPSIFQDTDGTAWNRSKIYLKSMGDYTGDGFIAVLKIY